MLPTEVNADTVIPGSEAYFLLNPRNEDFETSLINFPGWSEALIYGFLFPNGLLLRVRPRKENKPS